MRYCPECNSLMNYEPGDSMPDDSEKDEKGWYVPKIIPSGSRGGYTLASYKCPKCGHSEYAFE